MVNFMDVLAAVERASAADGPNILPEAAAMRLRELYARYAEQMSGPRFAPGQLVTPISGSDLRRAGAPHIVLETRKAEPDLASGRDTTSVNGRRCDMRVAVVDGSVECAFWVESFTFELWIEPAAETAA